MSSNLIELKKCRGNNWGGINSSTVMWETKSCRKCLCQLDVAKVCSKNWMYSIDIESLFFSFSRVPWLLQDWHKKAQNHQRSKANSIWIHYSATCCCRRRKMVRDLSNLYSASKNARDRYFFLHVYGCVIIPFSLKLFEFANAYSLKSIHCQFVCIFIKHPCQHSYK